MTKLSSLMNHLKTYLKLIRKVERRGWKKSTAPIYTETHHVFPKCVYGQNSRVVQLTAREHFIAHALLAKVAISRWGISDKRTWDLVTAFSQMGGCKLPQRNGSLSSRMVELGRKMFCEVHSLRHRGKNNPTFGFQWWTNGHENYFGLPQNAPSGWKRGKTVSDSQRVTYSWYTNGSSEIKLLSKEPIPEGFYHGRLPQPKRKKRRPRKWITDGSQAKQILKDKPIPPGWQLGRTSK